MERTTTAERLKTLMQERNLKQVDILNLALPFCKKYNVSLNKSNISQYVSGLVEPSQDKLVILGLALNVTEAWLMGFDYPKERNSNFVSAKYYEFYYNYCLLDENDKLLIKNIVEQMLQQEKYNKKKKENA